MPNKTIYISDQDMPLVEEAADMAGGLSPAIIDALKDYVHNKKAQEEGYETVTVNVVVEGKNKKKEFKGKPLATVKESYDGYSLTWQSYLTPKNRIALVSTEEKDFVGFAKNIAENTASNVEKFAKDVETGIKSSLNTDMKTASEHWKTSAMKWASRGVHNATQIANPKNFTTNPFVSTQQLHVYEDIEKLQSAITDKQEVNTGSTSRYIPTRLLDATQSSLSENQIEILDI